MCTVLVSLTVVCMAGLHAIPLDMLTCSLPRHACLLCMCACFPYIDLLMLLTPLAAEINDNTVMKADNSLKHTLAATGHADVLEVPKKDFIP